MRPQAFPQRASAAVRGRLRNALLLIHYFLPVVVGWSLTLVMQRAIGSSISPSGLVLLLSGIGAAYSFDRLIDASPASTPRPLWLHRTLCLGFIVSAFALFILLVDGTQTGLLVACGILSAGSLFYSFFKRIPLIKTLGVAIVWTWACATLPFADGRVEPTWAWLKTDVSLPLLLLLCANCILCDLKDAMQDRRDRIPSLPVLVGIRWACLVATSLALASAGTAAMHHRAGVAIAGILLAAVAQFPVLLTREPIGPIVIDSILVVSGVLISTGVV